MTHQPEAQPAAQPDTQPVLENLIAAVERHRPKLLNRYGHPTDKPDEAKWIRCGECEHSVTLAGCTTWSTAYPQQPTTT